MRRIEGRIMSVVNGKSIICIATNKSEGNERRQDNNTRVKEALLYSNSSNRRNEGQSQPLWLLYKGLLKGGSTLKLGLSTLVLFLLIGPRPIMNGIQMNGDRKSTRLNSSHSGESRMPSSA